MKKLISFKVLKSICAYEFNSFCERRDCGDLKCNSKTCPVWKKLKEVLTAYENPTKSKEIG